MFAPVAGNHQVVNVLNHFELAHVLARTSMSSERVFTMQAQRVRDLLIVDEQIRTRSPFLLIALKLLQIQDVRLGQAIRSLGQRWGAHVVQHHARGTPCIPLQRVAVVVKGLGRKTRCDDASPIGHGVSPATWLLQHITCKRVVDIPVHRVRAPIPSSVTTKSIQIVPCTCTSLPSDLFAPANESKRSARRICAAALFLECVHAGVLARDRIPCPRASLR